MSKVPEVSRLSEVSRLQEKDILADDATTRRGKLSTLLFLAAILIVTVYAPTIRWGWQALLRGKTIQAGEVRAEVARTWMVRQSGLRLEAWRPCLTSFCMVPPAAISLMWMGRQTCSHEIAMQSAKVVLARQGLGDLNASAVRMGTVSLDCLDAAEVRSNKRMDVCYNTDSCIFGTFEGNRADLEAFYQVTATARHTSEQTSSSQ